MAVGQFLIHPRVSSAEGAIRKLWLGRKAGAVKTLLTFLNFQEILKI